MLEVSETADASEITKAYRKLSLKYHPDKVPENESYKLPLYKIKLEEVQTAYKALIPDN
ncbi:MAG TPA: DnaJ domain-containing protein [Chlamydiales bacterium]|nr:DnaJ domain-containing protein [Chlamydiales bacterium]